MTPQADCLMEFAFTWQQNVDQSTESFHYFITVIYFIYFANLINLKIYFLSALT